MSEQPGLFNTLPVSVARLVRRFKLYHAANPHIYQAFCRYAFEAIDYKNCTHLGAQTILEKMRWETSVAAKNDTYKINNDYASFYARMFMRDYPAHKGFFRLRKSVADDYVEANIKNDQN